MVETRLEWGAIFPQKDDTKERQDLCYHDWDANEHWGVIIGLSRCTKCGKLSRVKDFPWLFTRKPQS